MYQLQLKIKKKSQEIFLSINHFMIKRVKKKERKTFNHAFLLFDVINNFFKNIPIFCEQHGIQKYCLKKQKS